jgi:hypothetical protein
MSRQNPAKRDQNDVAVALGVSSVDGVTPIMLAVDPVTDYLLVDDDGASATIPSAIRVRIDQNDQKTKYGVSSADGKTLIPIRTDSNGRLQIQYN